MIKNQQIIVGNKRINISKWKAKHKKIFKKMFSEDIPEKQVLNELVYECIDTDAAFSPEEFKYILCKIREFTLGEDITFNLFCDKCEKPHTQVLKISDIIKPKYTELNTIEVKDVTIKLSDIRNRDFYMDMLENRPDNADIIDFVLRIESINGNDNMSFDEVIDYLDSLDLDIYEEIMEIWENSKFKIDDINEVKCPNCGDVQKYEFDDLPGFFPDDWLLDRN